MKSSKKESRYLIQKMVALMIFTIFLNCIEVHSQSYKKAYKSDVEKSRDFYANFDDVWNRLVNWFAVRGIRIETIEKASGLIQVQTTPDKLKLTDYPFASCGRIYGKELPYKKELRFNVTVTNVLNDRVNVDINLFFEGWQEQDPSNPTKKISINCYSTGYLENAILNYVSQENVSYLPPAKTAEGDSKSGSSMDSSRTFWYFGLGTLGMNTSDFEDVHISDWETMGTGSAEGRVALNLSKADAMAYPIYVNFGTGAYLGKSEHKIVLHLFGALGSSSLYALGIGLGFDYALYNNDNFRVGLLPQLNYVYQAVDFGAVEMLQNKIAPVIVNNKEMINLGDNIKALHQGLGAQGLLTAKYKFSDKFAIQFNGGYMYSLFFGDLKVEVSTGNDNDKKVSIDFKNKAVVEAIDGSTTNPGIKPKADCTGLNLFLTFEFAI